MHINPEDIKNLIQPVLNDERIELVDLIYRWESGRNVLRLLVDKPGGISLDDCTRVNKILSGMFDKPDIIDKSFVLEVSSPGLDRPLSTKRDFERNVGKKIKLIVKNNKGATDTIIGDLKSVVEDRLILNIKGIESQVLFADIMKAKLEIEL